MTELDPIAKLEAQLAKAKETQALATEGLTEAAAALEAALAPFELDEDGNAGGTPEELEGVTGAVKDYVAAVRANWKFRGLPTQTEERRTKAIEATRASQARKAIKDGKATDEQIALIESLEAAKAAKAEG